MLDVSNLQVHYGSIAALRGVSLSVSANELVAIVGANGAGKSSLLMAVAGGLAGVRGSVEFLGRSIQGRPPEAIARAGISLVPEGRDIFAVLTVEENLRLGACSRQDRSELDRDIERELERFPVLRRYFKANAGKLSGGEQQQLAIARGLLSRPALLMLDEPSLGLAPKVVDLVFEVVRQLPGEGVAVLLVEQMANRAVELADRGYILRSGEIVASGTAAQLDRALAIESALLGGVAS